MKKFSKILVALLSLSLLVAVFSVVSAAADSKTGSARLNITKDPYNVYNDFSEGKTGTNVTWGQATENDGDQAVGVNISYNSGYFRIWGSGGQPSHAGNSGKYWAINYNQGAKAGIIKSNLFETDYTVLDFEFAADRYTFSYTADVQRTVTGGKNFTENLTATTLYTTATLEEVEEYFNNPALLEGEFSVTTSKGTTKYATQTDVVSNVQIDESSLTPSYLEGAMLGSALLTSKAAISSTASVSRANAVSFGIYIVRDTEGNWYFSNSNSYKADATNYRLSNKVGVADHISIVFDNGISNEGYITYTIYMNGEYYYANKLSAYAASTYTYIAVRGTGFILPAASKAESKYSLMIDNVGYNWYRANPVVDDVHTTSWEHYNSGAKYGVDDLITDLKAGVINPIYNCEDVLYKSDYYSSNGAVIVDNNPDDDAEGEYVSLSAYVPDLLTKIKNGAKVTVEIDVDNFDVPDGVDNFTLSYNARKVNLSFSDSFNEKFLCLPNGKDSYTVRTLIDSDYVKFNYSVGGALVKSTRIPFTRSLETGVNLLKLKIADSTLYSGSCTSWTFDIDGSYENAPMLNLYPEEAVRTLSYTELKLVNEEFGGNLEVKGDVSNVSFSALSISDYKYFAGYVVNGELYVLEDSQGGYNQYKDLTTLEAESANWGEGVKCYKVANGSVSEYNWSNAQNLSMQDGEPTKTLWHTTEISGAISILDFSAPALDVVPQSNFEK